MARYDLTSQDKIIWYLLDSIIIVQNVQSSDTIFIYRYLGAMNK